MLADHVFYLEDGPRDSPRLLARMSPRVRNQTSLEAFS